MKDRALLLAGLVDEDDLEKTRHMVVEDYVDQLKADRKIISEQVKFVEEDEQRLGRMIGAEEVEPEWEGSKKLEESAGIAMGGYGPGFAGQKSFALGMGGGVSSRYTPNTDDIYGAIIGKDYGKSEWAEVQNPKVELFRKIGESNPYAFDGGSSLSEMELPEFDEDFNPILGENEKAPSLFNFDTNDRYAELQEKLNSGEFAAEGGIGPGFSAYSGPKEIKNPYEGHLPLERWYMNENEELDEDFKEQTDLPGELADIDLASLQAPQGAEAEMPNEINLATANLSLVGEQDEQYVYSITGDDAMVGVSQDVEGWYAQVRDALIGLAGEGYGDTPEAAVEEALGSYSGNQQEMPSTLQQTSLSESFDVFKSLSLEENRTGTPDDGLHIKYTEGNPTMYPDAPEEPSSEGHPGLPGWDFYDGDHTKQKLDDKMDDVLDQEETDVIDIFRDLLDKNAVYKEAVKEEGDILEETEEDAGNMEYSSGMSTSFSIEQ